MDIKEAERVVVAKPVASRPSCTTFRSFSELLAGAINDSPTVESSQTTISAIRPKTVRFKPAMNHPPSSGFISSEVNVLSSTSERLLSVRQLTIFYIQFPDVRLIRVSLTLIAFCFVFYSFRSFGS